jgi:hypothetical protein
MPGGHLRAGSAMATAEACSPPDGPPDLIVLSGLHTLGARSNEKRC